MQIAGNRRGRGHRARQPEVKRKLRALGQRPQQHQRQHGRIQRVRADLRPGGQHGVQVIAARHATQHQHPRQQAQAARARHRQRHARAAPRVFAVMPVADEQKRKQARQLPEKHQLNQIARQHHAHHRAHEGEKKGEKAWHRIVLAHVVARVHRHQKADARHHQREQPGKAVHPHHKRQPRLRQPCRLLAQHLPALHLRIQQQHPAQPASGHQRRPACRRIAGLGRHHGSHKTADKREQDEPVKRHGEGAGKRASLRDRHRRHAGGTPLPELAGDHVSATFQCAHESRKKTPVRVSRFCNASAGLACSCGHQSARGCSLDLLL